MLIFFLRKVYWKRNKYYLNLSNSYSYYIVLVIISKFIGQRKINRNIQDFSSEIGDKIIPDFK